MAFQSATLAAGRPLARGPPALTRRRAFSPMGVRLSIPAFRDFAHVGKILGLRPRKRLPLDYGKRAAGQPSELPTRTSTRDSLRGRSRRGAATPRPWRRPRRSAPLTPWPRCRASPRARRVGSARPAGLVLGPAEVRRGPRRPEPGVWPLSTAELAGATSSTLRIARWRAI